MSSENHEWVHFGQAFRFYLERYMRRFGTTMNGLAAVVGVSRQTISNWRDEDVRRPPNVERIILAADAMFLTESETNILLKLAGKLPLKELEYDPQTTLTAKAKTLIEEIINRSESTQAEDIIVRESESQAVTGIVVQPETIDLDAAYAVLTQMPLDDVPPVAPSLPVGSSIPFSSNPLFVGRDEELSELAAILKGNGTTGPVVIAAITGPGGMGKTQLATELAHRYGPFFAGGVFWVNMENPKENLEVTDENGKDSDDSTVRQAIVAAGRRMPDLPVNFSEMELKEQTDIILDKWQQPVPRLLIFDNCENSDVLDQWRPKTGGSRLLVTCRRAEWDTGFGIKTLPLKELGRKQSISLLHKSRKKSPFAEEDKPFLDDIADELGDLPLALHLAGYYLAKMYRKVKPKGLSGTVT